jgi:hypothetical protein
MTAIATTQRPYRSRTAVVRPRRAVRRRPNVALRRRIAAVVVVALLAVLVSGLWAMRSEASSDAGTVEATVVVAPGETVWDIAAEYTPAGAHPQAYVAQVLRYNDLDASAVLPGTVLRLPRG